MNKFISSVAAIFGFFLFCTSGFAQTQAITIQTFDQQILTGILTLPAGEVQGAALILQGSGNVGADGDVTSPMIGTPYHGLPAKLSEQIANELAQVGVASLRYAKRGVDDPRQLPQQTMPFLVKDAESALKLLQSRFSGQKIAVVGLSEGALVAMLVAGDLPVDALYLLSLPTRPIDELFGYQFFSWPTELLTQHFDPLQVGSFAEPVTFDATIFNLYQAPTWPMIDLNQDHQISEESELYPAYQKYYFSIREILASPAFAAWYQGMKAVPAFSEVAGKIMSKANFIYQGKDDPQVRWNWVQEDAYAFPVPPTIHLFDHAGHCFSPLDGPYGGVKTSGPLSDAVLTQLGHDVATVMNP